MRPSRRPIIIATRRSRLAQAQAKAVARALARLHPSVEVELLNIASEGDRRSAHPLGPGTGKGLFTGAVEAALLSRRADLAVHSLKDLPTTPTAGLVLGAVPRRGDVRDCLISEAVSHLEQLGQGATLGTSSLRRQAQLRRWRGDLKLTPIRGNIETRIARAVGDGDLDGVILATVGLQRAGLSDHPHAPIDVDRMLPAPGQAALAIQVRADDHVTLRRVMPLNDPTAATCVETERSVSRSVGADCHTPIGALAEPIDGGRLRLRVRLLSVDGQTCLEVDRTGSMKAAQRLADEAAEQLDREGAERLVRNATIAARQMPR